MSPQGLGEKWAKRNISCCCIALKNRGGPWNGSTGSWRSVLNINFLSSHFSGVDDLLNEQWAKIVRRENISTPIYVQCANMYQWKVQRFAVKNSGASCLTDPDLNIHLKHWIRLETRKWKSSTQNFVQVCETWKFIIGRHRFKSPLVWNSLPCRVSRPFAILCGTMPVSGLTRAYLYCCTLYNFSSWRHFSGEYLAISL